jgi:hypothetical protein
MDTPLMFLLTCFQSHTRRIVTRTLAHVSLHEHERTLGHLYYIYHGDMDTPLIFLLTCFQSHTRHIVTRTLAHVSIHEHERTLGHVCYGYHGGWPNRAQRFSLSCQC